jgi:methionyl-tRNA formyltransferase
LTHGLPVLDPHRPRGDEFLAALAATKPDLGVVVAYGRILPESVLQVPTFGCINAHGSLLPALRGAAPIERAILAGHTQTGVTIMQMDAGMDTGDMLASRSIAVPEDMDAGTLREAMAELSADMFVAAIEDIAASRTKRTPQDPQLASYAPPLRRAESRVDWERSAIEVSQLVRAFAPAPGAFTFADQRRLKVLATSAATLEPTGRPAGFVLGIEDSMVRVACGRGSIGLTHIQPEGKRSMSAIDYARGAEALSVGRILGAQA